MMLIDDLLGHHVRWAGERTIPRPWLQQAQVYNIDEVARLFALLTRQEDIPDWVDDVPNAAPLGPAVWLEWCPRVLPSGYFRAYRPFPVMGQLLRAFDLDQHTVPFEHAEPEIAAQSRWLVHSENVWALDDGRVFVPSGYNDVYVRPDGSVAGYYRNRWRSFDQHEVPWTQDQEDAMALVQTLISQLAVCFAHCRNVQTQERQQTPTRQQRRLRERQGDPPLVSYRVIDINPLATMLRSEGRAEETGLHRAMHLCRAHFKHWAPGTYMGRPQAPAMTLYVPLHLRGQDRARVVRHNYHVHAPQTPQQAADVLPQARTDR